MGYCQSSCFAVIAVVVCNLWGVVATSAKYGISIRVKLSNRCAESKNLGNVRATLFYAAVSYSIKKKQAKANNVCTLISRSRLAEN